MKQPLELFSNVQLDLTALPNADHLEMIPLEKSYKTVRYISGGIIASIMTLIVWVVVIIEPRSWPYGFYLAVLVSLVAVWIIIYNGVSFHHMGYALREKDI